MTGYNPFLVLIPGLTVLVGLSTLSYSFVNAQSSTSVVNDTLLQSSTNSSVVLLSDTNLTGDGILIEPSQLVTTSMPQLIGLTVNLGWGTSAITYNPVDGNIYVTNPQSNKTSVIDSRTDTSVRDAVIPMPDNIFFEPESSTLYVISSRLDTIFKIDTSLGNVGNITGFNFGYYSVGVVYNPVDRSVYVTNLEADSVSKLPAYGNYIQANITGLDDPRDIAYNPTNGKMYVANSYNTLSVIDPSLNYVVKRIEVSSGFDKHIAYNPSNGKMYVASGKVIDIIDPLTDTRVKTIPLGLSSNGLSYNPADGNMYILTRDRAGSVVIIDSTTDTILWNLRNPYKQYFSPIDITYNPSNGKMYVLDQDGSLSTISP